jgi:hypothetical protein
MTTQSILKALAFDFCAAAIGVCIIAVPMMFMQAVA